MTTSPIVPAPYTLELRATFDDLLYILAQLEDDEIENGHLANTWTPKALVAHVAFWDNVQRRRMEDALGGARSFVRPPGDNESRAAAEQRPIAEVLAEAEAARTALIAFAASLPAEALARNYPEDEHTLSFDRLLLHMVQHTRQHRDNLFAYAASLQRWGRAGLRELLVVQHSLLMDSIAGLEEQTIITTRNAGGWTLREQLIHLMAWSEYRYLVLADWPALPPGAIAEWQTHSGEGEDEVNARLLAKHSAMNIIEIADMLGAWHRRTLARFDALDDATLGSAGDYGWGAEGPLCRFLYSMCLHQAEHALEIWESRE